MGKKYLDKKNVFSIIKDMKVILASSSARRKEFFSQLGIDGKIIPSDVEEVVLDTPEETAVYNAVKKVRWVNEKEDNVRGYIIVGFDTLVFHEGEILGKPKNKEDSVRMLKSLSGMWHSVFTGVALFKDGVVFQDYDVSNVKFHELNDFQILYYVDSGQSLDKAGSYGIQDKNMSFIDRIEGSFSNVVGFPLKTTRNILNEVGFKI
jgi:septum formation protein